MRVAHVISTPRGFAGAEAVVLAIVEAGLAADQTHVVMNPFTAEESSELSRRLPPGTWSGMPLSSPLALPALRRRLSAALNEWAPDVVHAHLFHAQMLVATLKKAADYHRVLTHHHGALFAHQGRWVRTVGDRWSLRRFDAVVGVSVSVSEHITALQPGARIRTVLNGWTGTPRPKVETARPTAVCVAAFRPEKEHEDLLAAWSLVREAVPRAQLILVGDGPGRAAHESAVRRTDPTGDSVVFAGAVRDVWPWYAQADVLALASSNEPFGIVLAEAMAAGLAIVATNVGGIPEIVRDGIDGILVEPHDPHRLAVALTRLLTDDHLRAKMAQSGRLRSGAFRLEQTAQDYLALYRDVCGDDSP